MTFVNFHCVMKLFNSGIDVVDAACVSYRKLLLYLGLSFKNRSLCAHFDNIQQQQEIVWHSLDRGTELLAPATIAANAIQTKIYFTDLLTLVHCAEFYRNCSALQQ